MWGDIVAELFSAASGDASVVMVICARQPPPGFFVAMHLVNQRRDSIARALARPLLWCGPAEVMKLTWERAPDFWSIRALSLRIDDDAKHASLPPLWPATWVSDPPERLRAMLDAATRQGDENNAARVALMLADALASRGKIDDAVDVMNEVKPSAEIALARAIAEARSGHDAHALEAPSADPLEGRRLMALANVRRREHEKRAEARVDYAMARDLFARSGDHVNEALATANLGVLALANGDVDGAIDLLEAARATLATLGDDRSEAEVRVRLGGALLVQRDARRASACVEEALPAFRETGDRAGECRALLIVARAYLELGDAEKARDDATRAASLARAVGDEGAADEAAALRDAAIAAI
jgi:tetratricopeptide (TPR) repeat protein